MGGGGRTAPSWPALQGACLPWASRHSLPAMPTCLPVASPCLLPLPVTALPAIPLPPGKVDAYASACERRNREDGGQTPACLPACHPMPACQPAAATSLPATSALPLLKERKRKNSERKERGKWALCAGMRQKAQRRGCVENSRAGCLT